MCGPMHTTDGSKKLAVVTGASSGIGKALAGQFARNGYDLLISAEDGGIEAAAAELRALGAQVRTVRADLATYEGVEELAGAIESASGALDVVAINAGVGVGGASFDESDLRAQLKVIDLNVTGSVHLAKRAIPLLRARTSGRLAFTSSIAALMPGPFESVYAASKAFLLSFSEAIRNELKDTGVTVTAFLPGPTDTNFFERAGMQNTPAGTRPKDDPDDVARQAYDAIIAGKDHQVVGSLKTKLQAAVTRVLPETVKGEVHRGEAKPMESKTES